MNELADARVQKLARDLYAIAHQCSVDNLSPADDLMVDLMAERLWQAFDALRSSLSDAWVEWREDDPDRPGPSADASRCQSCHRPLPHTEPEQRACPGPPTCEHGKTDRHTFGEVVSKHDAHWRPRVCPGPSPAVLPEKEQQR